MTETSGTTKWHPQVGLSRSHRKDSRFPAPPTSKLIPDHLDLAEDAFLPHPEIIQLHQLEHGEEGDDHLVFGGRAFEEGGEGHRTARRDEAEEVIDLVAHGVLIIDDLTETFVVEAVEDVLEGADEVEDAEPVVERTLFVARRNDLVGPVREMILLPGLPLAEFAGGFLEFLVLDELPDQVPARILLVGVLLGRLDVLGQHHPALDVAEIRGHHEELAGEPDVEQLEGVQIGHVLLRDPLDRDVVDVDLLLLDEVEEQVHRSLEDVEFDLVGILDKIVRIKGAGPFALG